MCPKAARRVYLKEQDPNPSVQLVVLSKVCAARKPAAHVTSGIGYVRLHGRNYRNCFSAKADVRGRYDHLYSPAELDPWITRSKQIARDAEDTYVISSNHNLGKATVNALESLSVLKVSRWRFRLSFLKSYPELRDFAEPSSIRSKV